MNVQKVVPERLLDFSTGFRLFFEEAVAARPPNGTHTGDLRPPRFREQETWHRRESASKQLASPRVHEQECRGGLHVRPCHDVFRTTKENSLNHGRAPRPCPVTASWRTPTARST